MPSFFLPSNVLLKQSGLSMKKSDIGVVTIIYAICLFFFVMTLDLKADAQTYPLCLIGGLFGLNTLYLIRCVWMLCRQGGRIQSDLSDVFNGFLVGQFTGLVLGCIGYMVLMYFAGFYIASVAYLVGTMLFLHVPVRHLVITVGVLAVMLYAVFTLFLKVPLPVGLLFK